LILTVGPDGLEPSTPWLWESNRDLHRVVSVCTSLSYFTLKVKYYTGLHGFVEILAKKLATNW